MAISFYWGQFLFAVIKGAQPDHLDLCAHAFVASYSYTTSLVKYFAPITNVAMNVGKVNSVNENMENAERFSMRDLCVKDNNIY